MLERYRVPKRLVGRSTPNGEVPARLRPVFRDREDLSSAADLTARIKQELAASENLIVICSPAAAESRWVSEEIRHFRELGRADRILAVVVDGDPQADSASGGCFPPALLESGDGQRCEPLAADIRRYNDGRHIGLLKVIAGVLGIRLDELRRRDAQRRLRRRLFNGAVAVTLALVIAWLFHSAQSSREAVRLQRAGTEEMLSFMLGELDRLDPIQGLESIAADDETHSTVSQRLGLDALDNEALLDRALELRELGQELDWEGDTAGAESAYEDSRAALIELHQREGNTPRALFELGQAEFYVGEMHVDRGEVAKAEHHWSRYGALTRRLVNAAPYNPKYVMELSYTLMNLGALEQVRSVPDIERSLRLLQAAVQYAQLALMLDPDNTEYRRALATELEWTADAQMGICALGDALEVRQETVAVRRKIVQDDPESAEQRRRLAFTLSGLAGVQQSIGLADSAIASFRESVDILKAMSAREPENANLAWEALYREARLARLLAATGDQAAAAEIMTSSAPRVRELAGRDESPADSSEVDLELFEIEHARLLIETGNLDEGGSRLRAATARLAELTTEKPDFRDAVYALAIAYFEYWQHFGESPGETVEPLLEPVGLGPNDVMSCHDAGVAARLSVARGDLNRAEKLVDYALQKGYFEPGFVAFCRRYALCEGR
jgi:tetratricopeptide (TPR) repeat protein